VIHYSCDRCKRSIDSFNELRYVVRMEVSACMADVEACQDEAERDHLLEIHEILERAEDAADELISEDVYRRQRFDLCPECYRRFLKRPLGESTVEFDFSEN